MLEHTALIRFLIGTAIATLGVWYFIFRRPYRSQRHTLLVGIGGTVGSIAAGVMLMNLEWFAS